MNATRFVQVGLFDRDAVRDELAALDQELAQLDELADENPRVDCDHARIFHESRARSSCRDCGATMRRHNGDWRAQ